MKVTVDTRHDSLEEALATVHAAFGSSTTQPTPAGVVGVATRPVTAPAATPQATKRAGSRTRAAASRNQQVTGKEVTGKEVTCHDRCDEDRCNGTSASSKNPGRRRRLRRHRRLATEPRPRGR